MPTSLERIAHELAQGLAAVHVLLEGDNGPAVILQSLGWDLPPGAEDVGLAALDFSDLVEKVLALEDDLSAGTSGSELDAEFAELLIELGRALIHVQAAIAGLSAAGDYLDKTRIKDEFLPRLTSAALTSRLAAASPFALLVMQATGVVTVEHFVADPTIFQIDHVRPTIHYDALGRLFTDPVGQIESRYGWGTADFDGDALIGNLSALVEVLGVPVRRRALPRRVEEQLRGAPVPEADTDPVAQLIASLVRGDETSGLDVGVSLYPLRATTAGSSDGGLGVSPFVHGSTDLKFPLTDVLSAEFQASLGLDSGVALELRPNVPATIKAGLLDPDGVVDAAAGKVLLLLTFADPDGGNVTLLTLPGGGLVEAKSIAIGGGVDVAHAGLTPAFAARLTGGHAALRTDDADSFLGSILPRDGVEAHFDLGLGWSGAEGFSFEGSAQAGTDLPVHLAIAGFRIDYLHVGLGVSPAGVPLELSVTGGGTLGPLSASVERLGTIATLAFHDGNLGPVDLTFAFKAPTGVGLSIDAGIVAGGGFLSIDPDRGEYAGALQLVLADFLTVGAIGLITTKLPDGTPGFSLLIVITAEFGSGIQLGFGFTLIAVGGLIGLNRAMLLQPLVDAVRTGAIDSVMFPRDVVANAPRIISDLRTFFPPQQGTFLIGPMAKLGWGEPTLISLSLAVIVEIPPGDIAILGKLKAALPEEDAPLLVLQANFLGAFEFDKQRFFFFASLFDSHLLFITIEGELGVLFAYGQDANFVLSVGGFHPKFNPPPLPFPTPKRIQLDIINESYARIRAEGYFAVTTNTVQFGTRAEYFFGFSALSVSGHSSFDALIQISPFHFSVEISTAFSVKVFGLGVYGVDIDLTIEGPTPWHAHGTAKISFFFFSIHIGIDFTWGDDRETSLPPVAVMPIVGGELDKQSNWRAVLPTGSNLLVSLRKLEPAESQFVLHPVGTLQVSQRAVPLDLVLDRVGGQKPSDVSRLTLAVSSADLVKTRDLQEPFAPAQFKDFGDADRLAQPAYVPEDSGIELSADAAYTSATAITRNVRYDLTIIDTKLLRRRQRFFVYPAALFAHFLSGASVTRSPFSAFTEAQTHPFAEQVAVSAETFAVALRSDNTVFQSDAAAFTSQASAADYIARAIAQDPTLEGTLHVLPQFEVAAA
ncbi:MAG TPA: DUF6603 domain-containing protein [Gaiellaceae bacterium]